MADVNLTVHTIDNMTPATGKITDNEITMAAANVYHLPNTGVEMFIVRGGSGGNLTIQTPQTVDGLAVDENIMALEAAHDYVFGPYPAKTYNQTDGKIHIVSSINDMKIYPFKKAAN